MGIASSATIAPVTSPTQPAKPVRPRGLSLFKPPTKGPSQSERLGATPIPSLTNDTVQFLIDVFDGLFCVDKGFDTPLQTSLLLDVIKSAYFTEGSILMTQGEIGDELFIIENGDVEVLVNGETVCHFRRGAVVGELAMLYDSPRSATIRCITNTSCYILTRNDFKAIQHITATTNIAKRTEWLQGVPEFGALGNVGLYKIVQALEVLDVKRGDFLYTKGVPTDRIFIVESGTAEIRTNNSVVNVDDTSPDVVRDFAVRSLSVKADAETIAMVDENFPHLRQSAKFSQKYCSFAGEDNEQEQVSALGDKKINVAEFDETFQVEEDEIKSMSSLSKPGISIFAPAEDLRLRQPYIESRAPSFCDDPKYMSGSVLGISLLSANARCKKSSQFEANVEEGEWAWADGHTTTDGQSDVIIGALPPFNVMITSETATVLTVSLCILDQIFGDFAGLWTELKECAAEGRQYILRKTKEEDNFAISKQEKLKHFKFSKFEQLCFIKNGTIGCSSLTRYFDEENADLNKVYYVLRKSKFRIVEHSLLQKNLDELSILKQIKSSFVAELVGLSESPDELFFVYENMGVRDLWSYIYEYNGAEHSVGMDQLKCIIASIVLGLDHIHSFGISYRELKPENISIDDLGKVRLSDFGSAKRIPFTKFLPNGKMKIHMKSFTILGTPGN